MTIKLQNARIVQPDKVIPDASLIIEEGRIASINPEASQCDQTINCNGATLFPGFIDVHIHGAVGIDVMNAESKDLGTVGVFLATQGVTGWLPTFVPASDREYSRAVSAITEAQTASAKGARIMGVHYEGPFVNSEQCGALHREYFKVYSNVADLDPLLVPAGIKMITLAPEISGGIELVKELTTRGWIVSIGHTRATTTVLNQACLAGARHMTHFMNAMAPLHHRNPGPIDWGLLRDDVTCDIIADGTHLDPSILKLLLKVKGTKRLSLISDAIAAAGRGDGDYQIWGETIAVKNGRTSNAAGSIAGSVITMLDAVKMMMSLGVDDIEIGKMAALNPALLLRIDKECGSIEVGKRADLTAVTDEGQVSLTVVGGKVVFIK